MTPEPRHSLRMLLGQKNIAAKNVILCHFLHRLSKQNLLKLIYRQNRHNLITAPFSWGHQLNNLRECMFTGVTLRALLNRWSVRVICISYQRSTITRAIVRISKNRVTLRTATKIQFLLFEPPNQTCNDRKAPTRDREDLLLWNRPIASALSFRREEFEDSPFSSQLMCIRPMT